MNMRRILHRFLSGMLILAFITTDVRVYAQGVIQLPEPGTRLALSPTFVPPLLKGIKVYRNDPFRFDFILDKGDTEATGEQVKTDSARLIKYFLASLTIPEKDLWVNLSPYEKDRIIPEAFGQTEMGRDLLAQDYILKQITASVIYPEGGIGKTFWAKVYAEAQKRYGTTDVPVDTFNKVWIVPEKATVYENNSVQGSEQGGAAFVVESKLKVMLETDYLAATRHSEERSDEEFERSLGHANGVSQNNTGGPSPSEIRRISEGSQDDVAKSILREVVIPILEKEVNEGKNFETVRQVYNSLILATWYKRKLKASIMGQAYVDQKKTDGIDIADKKEKEKIWSQYVEAFKKGAYNLIKEDVDPETQVVVPRKYFSGGITAIGLGHDLAMTSDFAALSRINLESLNVIEMKVDLAERNHQDVQNIAELKSDRFLPDAYAVDLGGTGVRLFPLGIGTARFGGVEAIGLQSEAYHKPSQEQINAVLLAAAKMAESGGRVMLDTANQYFDSEAAVGEFFRRYPQYRDDFYIATKWGLLPDPQYAMADYSKDNLIRSFKKSVDALGQVDLIYLHFNSVQLKSDFISFVRDRKDVMDEMRRMKRTHQYGVHHIGVSVSDEKTLELALNEGLVDEVDVVQVNARTYIERPDLVQRVREKKTGIVINSFVRKSSRDDSRILSIDQVLSRLLERPDPPVILTGTLNTDHWQENVAAVKEKRQLWRSRLQKKRFSFFKRKNEVVIETAQKARDMMARSWRAKDFQKFNTAKAAYERLTGGRVVVFANDGSKIRGLEVLSGEALDRVVEEVVDLVPSKFPYNKLIARKTLMAFQVWAGYGPKSLNYFCVERGHFEGTIYPDSLVLRFYYNGVPVGGPLFVNHLTGGTPFNPGMSFYGSGIKIDLPLEKDIRGVDRSDDLIDNLTGIIGGSGTKVERISLPGGDVGIRKSVLRREEIDPGKLANEVFYSDQLRQEGFPLPRILEKLDGDLVGAVLEDFECEGFVPMTSFSFENNEDVPASMIWGLGLDLVGRFAKTFYKQRISETPRDFIMVKRLTPLLKRFEETKKRAPVLVDMINAPVIGVSNIGGSRDYYPGFYAFLPFIEAIAKTGLLSPPYLSRIYGDLNYGNILFNPTDIVRYKEFRQYRLIDPKYLPDGEDYLYDIAKLIHHSVGRYDTARLDPAYGYAPDLGKGSDGVYILHEEIDDEYINFNPFNMEREMTDKIYGWLNATEDFFGLEKGMDWKIRLLFTNAFLVAGLPKFHLKGDGVEMRARTFYVTAVRLFYELMDMLMSKRYRDDIERSTPGISLEWQKLKTRLNALKVDKAGSSTGGIDLDLAQIGLKTKDNSDAGRFNMDPALLQRMQNAFGLSPVIMNIHPLDSLRRFMDVGP